MTSRRFTLFVVSAWLSGALLSLPVAAEEAASESEARPAATSSEIDAWIVELDDNLYLVREEATRQLLEAGAAALDPLLAAANADRPEPADRAVWILRRLARSPDNELAMAALERMIQLRGRPLLVEKAETELGERSVMACEQRLTPLGAEVSVQLGQFDAEGVARLMHVRLGDKWQGTTEDLQCLAELRQQLHFRLDGSAVDDEVVKLFEEKEQLAFLQLYDSRVTPAAVDALKQRHPAAVVYLRNEALLGVQAANHADGVLVQFVQQESAAAAAGIRTGDIIATIDGHALPDFDRLTARIAQRRAGETIDVEIIRNEERQTLSVTLGSWADQERAFP